MGKQRGDRGKRNIEKWSAKERLAENETEKWKGDREESEGMIRVKKSRRKSKYVKLREEGRKEIEKKWEWNKSKGHEREGVKEERRDVRN